jgi:hypothetical protein
MDIKLIYVSTCGMHGRGEHMHNFVENSEGKGPLLVSECREESRHKTDI